jgi:hypothetical protein
MKKAKLVTVKTKKDGKRVTSLGDRLPKGIYLHNKNKDNPSYRTYIYFGGKQVYVGTFNSITKAYKARNTRHKELTNQ